MINPKGLSMSIYGLILTSFRISLFNDNYYFDQKYIHRS